MDVGPWSNFEHAQKKHVEGKRCSISMAMVCEPLADHEVLTKFPLRLHYLELFRT